MIEYVQLLQKSITSYERAFVWRFEFKQLVANLNASSRT